MGKLTALRVRNAGPGRHSDGDGLMLLVKPTGGRSWVLRAQDARVNQGKRTDYGLGGVDLGQGFTLDADSNSPPLMERRLLTLAEAREKAAMFRRIVKAGRDPAAEIKRMLAPTVQIETVASVADKLRSDRLERWSDKTLASYDANLDLYIKPFMGGMPVEDVRPSTLADMLRPIWHSKPEVAKKVRQRACAILEYAHAHDLRSMPAPNDALTMLLGDRPAGENLPAMPYQDVPAFMATLRDMTERTSVLALQFIILTLARSGEARRAAYSQMEIADKLWNRPAEIMKGRAGRKKPHTITLNAPALAVIDRARSYRRNDNPDLIFPSPQKGAVLTDVAISEMTRATGFTPHGFRSTFRDWAAEQRPDIPDPVAEAALAHTVPDKVIAAYKRTQFIDMRRDLLDSWGTFCMGGVA